jgi:prohibitin 2
VSEGILKNLRLKIVKSGIEITGINIINFDFSKSFNDAIELKVTAEQQAQQAKNNLARIEFEGKQKVVTANAERDASIAKAQGTAEAIKIQADAIKANGGAEYIELRKIEAWEKGGSQVPQIVTSGTPLINIPSLK